MPTPNQTQDSTGITQPLHEIIEVIKALSPEKQQAAETRVTTALASLRTSTQQKATTIAAPDTTPFSREEFLDSLSLQHDSNVGAWKSIFQLSAKDLTNLAKKDDVIAWAKTVQPETIQGLKMYGEPRLKLLPDMEVEKLMQVIDQHPTIPGQTNGKIWWNQWNNVTAPAGSFGLTTDIEDMPFDPTIFYQNPAQKVKRTNEQMVAVYRLRFERTPDATIMPQYAYLGSVMDAMARGLVYDRQFWTVFERPQGADYLPRAGWRYGHVYLDGCNPDGSVGGVRSRLWVGGKRI